MIREIADVIRDAKKIAVLTGAGISTESGIPDFRSSNGLYKQDESLESLLSVSHFNGKPKKFWKVYKDIFNIKLAGNYLPNYGHHFWVEQDLAGKEISIITQNVDGLHTEAGSLGVIEMHGSIKTPICPKCKTIYNLDYIQSPEIPRCNKINGLGNICNFILKPSVVLFGDDVIGWMDSVHKILDSDLLIVLGSSLKVYPFNELPSIFAKGYYPNGRLDYHRARNKDRKMVIINKEATAQDHIFDYVIHAGIGKTLEEVSKVLNS